MGIKEVSCVHPPTVEISRFIFFFLDVPVRQPVYRYSYGSAGVNHVNKLLHHATPAFSSSSKGLPAPLPSDSLPLWGPGAPLVISQTLCTQ